MARFRLAATQVSKSIIQIGIMTIGRQWKNAGAIAGMTVLTLDASAHGWWPIP
jgi:hypothetical protein